MMEVERIATATSLPAPPHGLQQIMEVFGDIFEFIGKDGSLDARWETEMLAVITLPFAIPLSWNPELMVDHLRCHKLMAEIFQEAFERILQQGLAGEVTSLGGCYSFRMQRGGARMTTHAWGIAIDLNTATNRQGSAGDMSGELIELFRASGFTWGGNWPGRRCDPMHFQFCSGY